MMVRNFAQQWLDIQCQSIHGLYSALFLLTDEKKISVNPVAQWPMNSQEPLELMAIAQVAIKKLTSTVNHSNSDGVDYLATPIFVDKQLIGVVAIKTRHHDEPEQQKLLHSLAVGNKWLALPRQEQEQFFETIIKLSITCLQQNTVMKALTVLINTFSQEFICERVSIAGVFNQSARVLALSNSARFDDKTNLLRAIATAMEEAIDQDQILVYPVTEQNNKVISYAHAELARQYGSYAICTVPLVYEREVFAVLTMERSDTEAFDQKTIDICAQTLALISPFLKLKQNEEMSPHQKIARLLKQYLVELLGYRYLGLKLLILLACLLGIGAALIEGDFRIHANAVLEGRIQRAISAPLDGYIKSAKVRAGDTVSTDDVIAVMDNADLRLELVKLSSQQQQVEREYREAMAKRDLVKVHVLSSQIAQIDAQSKLKQEQIQRAQIKAPFDGVVIEGDLSQLLGAPVTRGDRLFKVAPLNGYRVILKVNERYISSVQKGQSGVLVLSSQPDTTFPLQIEKITEVAVSDDNSNIFRVEATLLNKPKTLRPGMAGVGKIDVGRKKLLWIWTHELVEWLKLAMWSWWP